MERPDRLITKFAQNKEVQAAAATGTAIAAVIVTGNSIDVIADHREQLTTTLIGTSSLAITYALLRRTLESAYRRHEVIGWVGFIGAAAYVADSIYNTWS